LRAAHTFEKPFKCDFSKCKRTFPTSQYKINHVGKYCAQNPKRKQDSQRKLTCYFCHVKVSIRTMSFHSNGHTGEKPYKCLHCLRPMFTCDISAAFVESRSLSWASSILTFDYITQKITRDSNVIFVRRSFPI